MTTTSEFYKYALTEGDILGVNVFFVVSVLSLIVGIIVIGLGIIVIRARPSDQKNQILALILGLEGIGLIGWQWSWAFPHMEWMVPLVDFGMMVRFISFIALSCCFLSLIGHQKHPMVRFLGTERMRKSLLVGGCSAAIIICVVAGSSLFHSDWSGVCNSPEHNSWMVQKFGEDWEEQGIKCDAVEGLEHFHYEYQPVPSAIILALYGSTSVFAMIAMYKSYHSMEEGTEKQQARAFGLAFGIKTGFIALGVMLSVALLTQKDRMDENLQAFFNIIAFAWVLFVLGLLVEAVMLAYGILNQQIFGIDKLFRKGMNNTILTIVVITVFTSAVELFQEYLSEGYGLIGGIGVALLMALGKSPMMLIINKATVVLMPEGNKEGESEASTFYRSQYHLMIQDGEISERDRTILLALSQQLELKEEQVFAIEKSVNETHHDESE